MRRIMPLAIAWCLSAPVLAQVQPAKTAVADEIFTDHPSMDRNAVVMPAPDAKPVMPIFAERSIGCASIARTTDRRWLLTGTTLRSEEQADVGDQFSMRQRWPPTRSRRRSVAHRGQMLAGDVERVGSGGHRPSPGNEVERSRRFF